jgi:ketosteroid isomerase-like protein
LIDASSTTRSTIVRLVSAAPVLVFLGMGRAYLITTERSFVIVSSTQPRRLLMEALATDLTALSEDYLAAWSARDPDRIVALHSEDTVFEAHAGSGPVSGREAVRDAFAELFEQWPNFDFEKHRLLLGEGHWVLDWTLLSSGGPAGDVRIGCLDVVVVDAAGLVARKDTYVDLADVGSLAGGA